MWRVDDTHLLITASTSLFIDQHQMFCKHGINLKSIEYQPVDVCKICRFCEKWNIHIEILDYFPEEINHFEIKTNKNKDKRLADGNYFFELLRSTTIEIFTQNTHLLIAPSLLIIFASSTLILYAVSSLSILVAASATTAGVLVCGLVFGGIKSYETLLKKIKSKKFYTEKFDKVLVVGILIVIVTIPIIAIIGVAAIAGFITIKVFITAAYMASAPVLLLLSTFLYIPLKSICKHWRSFWSRKSRKSLNNDR